MQSDTMRLTLSQRTVEEEREAAWLRALEAGEVTVDDLARLAGLSKKRIYARLKRAREDRVEAGPDVVAPPGGAEYPWVELVYRDRPETPHYDMATDRLEKPPGAFRIHTGRGLMVVQDAGWGQEDKTLADRKSYEPDPNGLKGGIG